MKKSPQDLHQALAEAFNQKSLEGLLSLYEKQATLIPQPGMQAEGEEQLQEALAGFVAMEGRMEVVTSSIIENGDLALARSAWKIIHQGEEVLASTGAELMRKQPEGNWLFVIDNPFAG